MTREIEEIKQIGRYNNEIKESVLTEESTKISMIIPVIQSLGYNTSDPKQFVPELVCDTGTKKGEKIDFAIMGEDNRPRIIIECKIWSQSLLSHENQLIRYFHNAKARFAVLTNGIQYRFYTDLDEQNRMDSKPFMEFDITNPDDEQIGVLLMFSKKNFNMEEILEKARLMKSIKETKDIITNLMENPPEWFVKEIARLALPKKMSITKTVSDEYNKHIKNAFEQIIKGTEDRIHNLYQGLRESKDLKTNPLEQTLQEEEKSGIVTTEEELEGYRVVCEILRGHIDLSRIVHRDTINYFGILLDDNSRKPICRLHFNRAKKYLEIFGAETTLTSQGAKQGTKYEIPSPSAINDFAEKLVACVMHYEEGEQDNPSDETI